jgi:uncharacterized membrane protein
MRHRGATLTARHFDHAGFRFLWLTVRRPRLATGVISGLALFAILSAADAGSGRLRFILSWDAGVLVATSLLFALRNISPDSVMRIAARQDAGKWAVLWLTLLAGSASLVAIAGEVPLIRHAGDYEKIARLALIVATIVLSWSFIHTIFALHYAHDYYLGPGDAKPRGLSFPGAAKPTYLDFAYFSFTIGMTFQVSDVQVATPALRALVLTHGVLSFFFATGILALTINMVAGLL